MDNFILTSAVQDYIYMSVMIEQYRHFKLEMNECNAHKIKNDAHIMMSQYKYDINVVDNYLNKNMSKLIKLPIELYPPFAIPLAYN